MSPSAAHLKLTQVNAFTRTPFDGARVAVCLLSEAQDRQYDDERLAKVAREFGSPEAVFAVKSGDAAFTLRGEASLSGLLALAHVAWGEGHVGHGDKIKLQNHVVSKRADHMAISLDVRPDDVEILELTDAAALMAMRHASAESGAKVVLATARTQKSFADFACRAFGPAGELAEIPFGHALLGAYWFERLPSELMLGEQRCEGRVAKISYERGPTPASLVIAGQAVTTLKGFLVATPS